MTRWCNSTLPLRLHRHVMGRLYKKQALHFEGLRQIKPVMQHYQVLVTTGHCSSIHTTKIYGCGGSAPRVQGTVECSTITYLIVRYGGRGFQARRHGGWRVTTRKLPRGGRRPGTMASERLEQEQWQLNTPDECRMLLSHDTCRDSWTHLTSAECYWVTTRAVFV
jgi:hypothetical protein